MIPVIKKYPELLGIGLSEGTAIIVKGDQFEVMGKWKVAIHDNTRLYQPWEKPYFVLGAGDVVRHESAKDHQVCRRDFRPARGRRRARTPLSQKFEARSEK